ncbi:MAG: peptidoglycan editing factor PgeF [Candidatus Omnitrophota bacterium]
MQILSEHFGPDVLAAFTRKEDGSFALPPEGPVFNDSQAQILNGSGISAEGIFSIRQVHGSDVLCSGAAPGALPAEQIPEGDAAIAADPRSVLTVRTADCLPIFLYDPLRKVRALVHAGWRSTRGRIVQKTLAVMTADLGCRPQDIRAVLGPGIRSCCYQVGQELCADFPEQVIPRQGDWYLDLPAVNRDQLAAAGIQKQNIADTADCTCCQQDYFSYRREGPAAGRSLAIFAAKG